jgi:hypothetical protein
VALTTIYTTVNLTQQDHNKYRVPTYWANNVVMRTWYLGVSKTWRWHVAAAVGRLGLTLALAQHVHILQNNYDSDFAGVLSPFLYTSYYGYPRIIQSQWETILIGFLVLCGFAVMETGLLAAFAMFCYQKTARSKTIILSVIGRLSVILLFVGSMANVYYTIRTADWDNLVKIGNGNAWHYYYSKAYVPPLEDAHLIAFTFLDDGTMLAAELMRPVGLESAYACLNWDGNYPDYCTIFDNRPQVFVKVLFALIAYASYIFAIMIGLQLAHYLHWRREQREGTMHRAPTDNASTV